MHHGLCYCNASGAALSLLRRCRSRNPVGARQSVYGFSGAQLGQVSYRSSGIVFCGPGQHSCYRGCRCDSSENALHLTNAPLTTLWCWNTDSIQFSHHGSLRKLA